MSFLFDERVILCILCLLTETDPATLYLTGCLVAEGLHLVALGLPPGLWFFFCCWEIMRLGELSLGFLNCSSGCLKPTPEFFTAFYKYSTSHEPQVSTETLFSLLCCIWFAFRFSVLCLFLIYASEQSMCITRWCTGSPILQPKIQKKSVKHRMITGLSSDVFHTGKESLFFCGFSFVI